MMCTGRRSRIDAPAALKDGRRSTASAVRRFLLAAIPILLILAGATPAPALDLLGLWKQSEVPLRLEVGGWVEYQTVTLVGGRRITDLTRLQCVGRDGDDGGDDGDGAWILEILPLVEKGLVAEPVPGEGVRIWVDDGVHGRKGDLVDLVRRVQRWQDGRAEDLDPEQWREDPLVASSLAEETVFDDVLESEGATRVVRGGNLLCRHFEMSAADTQSVRLPAGIMEQISSIEVTLAVSADVPLLGVAFAAERTCFESRLTPPSTRFQPPPAETKVETIELLGFGGDAHSAFTRH